MAEGTLNNVRGPAALEPAARWWKRISPKLVPVFAVVTALIVSMLFMMVTIMMLLSLLVGEVWQSFRKRSSAQPCLPLNMCD